MMTQKFGIVNDIDYPINKTNLVIIIATATTFLITTYTLVI